MKPFSVDLLYYFIMPYMYVFESVFYLTLEYLQMFFFETSNLSFKKSVSRESLDMFGISNRVHKRTSLYPVCLFKVGNNSKGVSEMFEIK